MYISLATMSSLPGFDEEELASGYVKLKDFPSPVFTSPPEYSLRVYAETYALSLTDLSNLDAHNVTFSSLSGIYRIDVADKGVLDTFVKQHQELKNNKNVATFSAAYKKQLAISYLEGVTRPLAINTLGFGNFMKFTKIDLNNDTKPNSVRALRSGSGAFTTRPVQACGMDTCRERSEAAPAYVTGVENLNVSFKDRSNDLTYVDYLHSFRSNCVDFFQGLSLTSRSIASGQLSLRQYLSQAVSSDTPATSKNIKKLHIKFQRLDSKNRKLCAQSITASQ